MIFPSLARFLKAHLNSDKPIVNLLPIWMRSKIKENPASDHAARILQAEFRLQELDSSNVFFILPKSSRAKRLLKSLNEYIHLMESTRFSRWLAKIEPKDFETASLE